MQITQELLKENLSYNQESGFFIRIKKTANSVNIGDIAGTLHSDGYIYISVIGKKIPAHRLAWLYVYGSFPNNEIDHINGIKNDNSLINLREATRLENMQNQRKAHKDNPTGLLGVSFNKKLMKFTAQIHINGKQKKLGVFDTKESAYLSYLEAKNNIHKFNTIQIINNSKNNTEDL